MDFDNLLTSIKEYYLENRQLILASILSTIVIITVIITMSFLKNDNNRSNTNNYLRDTSTKDSTETKKNGTKETTSQKNTEDESDSGLSDLDFTLPEDVTEETQTTLPDSEYKYMIKVNRAANCVTVYRQDDNGHFTVPHKAMACSTGKRLGNTPTGTFHTSSRYNWRQMVDGSYSQYATRIYNGILFHSVPCTTAASDKLEYEEFNKLGTAASLGCVRLTVADAKWIYENCSYGTMVEIYDDADNPGPLGKPQTIKIPLNSPNKDWDPTDPDPNNPWHKCEPVIEGYDVTIGVGNKLDLKSLIKAKDTCGNDVTSDVKISGEVNTNKIGKYPVRYSLKDAIGRTATLDVTINVANSASTQMTKSAVKYSPSSGTMPATDASPNLYGISPHTDNTTAPYESTQATTAPQTTTAPQSQTNPPESVTQPQSSSQRVTTPPTEQPTTRATEQPTTSEQPTTGSKPTTEQTTPEQTTPEQTTEPIEEDSTPDPDKEEPESNDDEE